MLNTSWIRFHWTKSFFLCKNLQCDSSDSLSEAVISSALFMKMITALLTRQRSLLRTVQTVTMKPPSSVFCLSDPRPHLLPDSQQLLIQTNRIITPPPLHSFSCTPLSFFSISRLLTSLLLFEHLISLSQLFCESVRLWSHLSTFADSVVTAELRWSGRLQHGTRGTLIIKWTNYYCLQK